MLLWLGRAVLWTLSTALALSIILVLIFRFVPVPFTPLMGIRASEMHAKNRPIKLKKEWVSLGDISPNLQLAVIASEDQRFFEHFGFDFEAIGKAADYNKLSKQKIGASTISQQVAKNVFLWPSRTWLRKGLEAYFTLLIEVVWSKERILEVYLNVIETGDGIFGAEAAAKAYFGNTASKLTPYQAALIAAALPSPRRWNPAQPNLFLRAKGSWIMHRAAWMKANHVLPVAAE